MTSVLDDENAKFVVLINDEQQYSLWPEACACPEGWRIVRPQGSRAECLSYIEECWTDIRPRSVVERQRES